MPLPAGCWSPRQSTGRARRSRYRLRHQDCMQSRASGSLKGTVLQMHCTHYSSAQSTMLVWGGHRAVIELKVVSKRVCLTVLTHAVKNPVSAACNPVWALLSGAAKPNQLSIGHIFICSTEWKHTIVRNRCESVCCSAAAPFHVHSMWCSANLTRVERG